jgi:hypothetical protein
MARRPHIRRLESSPRTRTDLGPGYNELELKDLEGEQRV